MMVAFDELRKRRNDGFRRAIRIIAATRGVQPEDIKHSFDFNSCYCGCPGGPCEHDWKGPTWWSEDGHMASVTCVRCGMTAMNHSMKVAP